MLLTPPTRWKTGRNPHGAHTSERADAARRCHLHNSSPIPQISSAPRGLDLNSIRNARRNPEEPSLIQVMCGIAGIYFSDGKRPQAEPLIARMTSSLTHRGPDEYGYHVDAKAALGHRRLSIIDLESGQQPMYNEDRTICVVFNGEIYNFAEIRDRLVADGHVFRTNSDTETIVHAYERWGERCVDAFRGMFAFAVRDVRKDRLFLARDRFGKKPLFYASYDGKFVFASEMKAILADPRFHRSIDDHALAAYYTFSYA